MDYRRYNYPKPDWKLWGLCVQYWVTNPFCEKKKKKIPLGWAKKKQEHTRGDLGHQYLFSCTCILAGLATMTCQERLDTYFTLGAWFLLSTLLCIIHTDSHACSLQSSLKVVLEWVEISRVPMHDQNRAECHKGHFIFPLQVLINWIVTVFIQG